ncbi:hypothetical protein WDZ17_04515 [Pseudokineococcus basanitobsidens]|uniref:DoxX-like protein n=1 Tax=Pseudokineococcus basanitobsidens TaxID=1926649 RepID=A0ABU8RHJ4_9ACTN
MASRRATPADPARGAPRARARRAAAARAMALSFTGTGALHLLRPAVFDGAVPRVLGAPRPWVLASGAAELVCAAALALPRTRRLGGALTTALLLAVWPGNVSMALRADRSSRASTARKVVTAARVPLQLPMLVVAADVARGDR